MPTPISAKTGAERIAAVAAIVSYVLTLLAGAVSAEIAVIEHFSNYRGPHLMPLSPRGGILVLMIYALPALLVLGGVGYLTFGPATKFIDWNPFIGLVASLLALVAGVYLLQAVIPPAPPPILEWPIAR